MTLPDAIKLIRKHYINYRRLPSYSEMGVVLGLASKKNSYRWASKLIDLGILGKDEKGRLFPKRLFLVLKLGVIHAGSPTIAEYVLDESIDLYDYFLSTPPDCFCLTVKGDSMKDAGLTEGDIVILDKNRAAKNGDVVAAFVDNEWTLKQFRTDKEGQVVLFPANPKYQPIFPKQSLEIGGVVVSSLRKYY